MHEERWLDIDTAALWGENPNEGDVGAIYEAIREFGYWGVLVLWNGVLKGGNHTIQALRLLKRDKWTPEGGGIKVEGGDWFVRYYDVSHMSEVRANALALALNRTARRGHDNPVALLSILTAIEAQDSSLLDASGYDADDVSDLEQLIQFIEEQERKPKNSSTNSDEHGESLLVESSITCPACGHKFPSEQARNQNRL